MFVVLSACRGQQIFLCGTNCPGGKGTGDLHLATFQKLEQPLGMLLLLIGSFLEYGGYLHVTFLLCLGGEKGVAIPCL